MADQPCGGVKWLCSCGGRKPTRAGARSDRTALSLVCDLRGNRPLPTSLFIDMWSRSHMSVRRRRVLYLYNFRMDVYVGRGASSCTVATVHRLFAFPSRFGTVVTRSSPSSICLHPSFCHCSIVFSMEGTGRKQHCYSCPNLKDDVVEELIDRCDVITSASMACSFKTILDSTYNIITRNPRV